MPQNKLKRAARMGNEDQLPGFPGYRTRPGRSGYDPLDTNREAGHMEGTFYRNLFTLRLRTRDAFYLTLMFIGGMSLTVLMAFAWYALIWAPGAGTVGQLPGAAVVYFLFGLVFLIGIALLVNFVINIGMILGVGRGASDSEHAQRHRRKAARKRYPKRRKDFR